MKNLHIYDRIIRIFFAIILIYLSDFGFNLYVIISLILLSTAAVGYCPIYRPVFVFSSSGKLNFQDEASKSILPELQNFKNLSQEDPIQVILNEKKSNMKYRYKDKLKKQTITDVLKLYTTYAYRLRGNTFALLIDFKEIGAASKCTKDGEKFFCTSLLNNAETALSEAKKRRGRFL